MKIKTKLLALLLAVVMLFCTSCEFIDNILGKEVTYSVTFETNGGSLVDSQVVVEGEQATEPEAPTREGYVFDGWYSDEKLLISWKFSTAVSADITLYAKWKEDISGPDFSREDSSMSLEEILAWYTYTDDEMDKAASLVDQMISASMTSTVEEVDEIYEQFETAFYYLAQQMTTASIIYYCDMSDEEAQERHLGITDKFYDLQDKYTQACRTIYLDSPIGKELFADWSPKEIQELLDYDPAIVDIRKEVEELQVKYDNLNSEAIDFDVKAVELYVQIVTKNNEIARMCGYDNYYEYATKEVYGRDYDIEDLAVFRSNVKSNISVRIQGLYNKYAKYYKSLTKNEQLIYDGFSSSPFDSTKTNYLLRYLNSLEGTMGESMRDVFESRNCVFSDNEKSHPTAFQTWLYADEKPFCLFGSDGQNAMTVVHEIGHYYAALQNNDLDSYDLLETHSQGNEFLFLNYCKDYLSENVYKTIAVEQVWMAYISILMSTMVDDFEQRIYEQESVEGWTVEQFDAVMEEVCTYYGSGAKWINEMLVTDAYGYWKLVAVSNPVYYVSYAISGIAALNIYATVEADKDAGFTAYTTLVEGVTVEDGFVGALKKAGLHTPFESESYTKISELVRKL